MQNPEQYLISELQAAVTNRPLPSAVYCDYLDPVRALGTGGSENWRIIGEAVNFRMLLTPRAASGAPPLFDPAECAAICSRLIAWFIAQRRQWMGTESNSTIYGPFYVASVAAIANICQQLLNIRTDKVATPQPPQIAAVLAEALAWLGYYLALCDATRDPISWRILQVGNRSGDREPSLAQIWAGWFCALAGDTAHGPIAAWESAGRHFGMAPNQSWIKATCIPLQSAFVAAYPGRTLTSHSLISPIHVLQSTNDPHDGNYFTAVYMAESSNGNTPALLAACSIKEDGHLRFAYLPANGGLRIRQKFDHGAVSVSSAPSGGDNTDDPLTLTYTTTLAALAPPNGIAQIVINSPGPHYPETVIG